jgi:peptidoglycan/LPS O-acetylase OafA/YrhL
MVDCVEEQFYLIWPLIILIIRKPKHLLGFMLIGLITILIIRSILWVYKIDNLIYFSLYTFTRVDGICIGCLVALLKKVKPDFIKSLPAIHYTRICSLNLGFFFFNRYYNFSFPYFALIGYTTFAMLFGVLVHEATQPKETLLKRVLSWKPLSFLGRLSFGLYIFIGLFTSSFLILLVN